EHIVCFKSCNAENWNSKGAKKLVEPAKLCDKSARRGLPLSLVSGTEGVSERLLGRINCEGNAGRFVLAERLQEQDAESVQRGSWLARCSLHRRQRVERSEEDGVRIDQQDRRNGHSSIIALSSLVSHSPLRAVIGSTRR